MRNKIGSMESARHDTLVFEDLIGIWIFLRNLD